MKTDLQRHVICPKKLQKLSLNFDELCFGMKKEMNFILLVLGPICAVEVIHILMILMRSFKKCAYGMVLIPFGESLSEFFKNSACTAESLSLSETQGLVKCVRALQHGKQQKRSVYAKISKFPANFSIINFFQFLAQFL